MQDESMPLITYENIILPSGQLRCHPVTLQDSALFTQYAQWLKMPISDLGFIQQYGWQPFIVSSVTELDGYLCGFFIGKDGILAYYPPIGEYRADSYSRLLLRLAEESAARGQQPIFDMVLEEWLDRFTHIAGWKATVSFDEAFSDYCYRAEDFLNLSGNVNESKRYQVRYFEKHYQSEYRPMMGTPQDLEDVITVMGNWCADRSCGDCYWGCEKQVISRLLEGWDKLNCKGAVILVEGTPAAFMIAEQVSADTVVSHFQKANRNYKGLYTYLSHIFYQKEYPGIPYINLQEDMGIEGLRKFKKQCRPYRMLRKYTITLTKAGEA